MSLASASQALSGPLQPSYLWGSTEFNPRCNETPLAMIRSLRKAVDLRRQTLFVPPPDGLFRSFAPARGAPARNLAARGTLGRRTPRHLLGTKSLRADQIRRLVVFEALQLRLHELIEVGE